MLGPFNCQKTNGAEWPFDEILHLDFCETSRPKYYAPHFKKLQIDHRPPLIIYRQSGRAIYEPVRKMVAGCWCHGWPECRWAFNWLEAISLARLGRVPPRVAQHPSTAPVIGGWGKWPGRNATVPHWGKRLHDQTERWQNKCSYCTNTQHTISSWF